jgi:hypothetical protein
MATFKMLFDSYEKDDKKKEVKKESVRDLYVKWLFGTFLQEEEEIVNRYEAESLGMTVNQLKQMHAKNN